MGDGIFDIYYLFMNESPSPLIMYGIPLYLVVVLIGFIFCLPVFVLLFLVVFVFLFFRGQRST